MNSYFVLIFSAVMCFNGSRSIFVQTEPVDRYELGGSAAGCGSTLSAVRASQTQLDKLDYIVQRISPDLKDNMELRFYKLLEKFEHFVEIKFNELDKKMDTKFQETNTYLESKLTVIESKITQCHSHIDSKVNILEVSEESSGAAAVVVNATKTIDEMNTRPSGTNITLEVNVNIHNLTDLVPDIVKNISKQDDTIQSTTEISHNVSTVNTTKEVNKPAPSRCGRTQQEQCCTVADVGVGEHNVYTEMSARGRHTVVNMTSAGLQEYTMYFALRGEYLGLLLSSTSPYKDLFYQIGFQKGTGGNINMYERLPTGSKKSVHDFHEHDPTNIISVEKYSYYYVTISGDTLEVGRRGEPPLMTHTSTKLRRLRYFSFSWGGYTAGAALYDCTAE